MMFFFFFRGFHFDGTQKPLEWSSSRNPEAGLHLDVAHDKETIPISHLGNPWDDEAHFFGIDILSLQVILLMKDQIRSDKHGI